MSRRSLRGRVSLRVLALALGLLPVSAVAGPPIKNTKLEAIGGGRKELLAKGRVNVLIFFRLGQAYSRDSLQPIDELRESFGKKPVRFLGLISDRYPPAQVAALLRELKVTLPVVRDAEDRLLGAFHVKMEPMVLIVGKQGRLVGSQPFRKVNFIDDVQARVRHALGEIDDAALDRILHPKARERPGSPERSKAKRYLRLARMLLGAGSLAPALKAITTSLADDPKLAAAHLVQGQILQAQKRCKQALAAFRRALALDPKLSTARTGLKACGGS